MAWISVVYEIPDGQYCTKLVPKDGWTFPDYDHCRFRGSTRRNEYDELVAYCGLFGELEIDRLGESPRKHPRCLQRHIRKAEL